MIDRRKFLRAALFVAAAPMIVKASSLMKVRALPTYDPRFQTWAFMRRGMQATWMFQQDDGQWVPHYIE